MPSSAYITNKQRISDIVAYKNNRYNGCKEYFFYLFIWTFLMLSTFQVGLISSDFPESAHLLDPASEHFRIHVELQHSPSVECKKIIMGAKIPFWLVY